MRLCLHEVGLRTELPNKRCLDSIGSPFPVCDVAVGVGIEPELLVALVVRLVEVVMAQALVAAAEIMK
jgi:hypothetical protein